MESIGVFSQIWLKIVVLITKRDKIRQVITKTQKFWKNDIPGSGNSELLRLLHKATNIFLTYICLSTCMFLFKPLLVRGTTIYYYYPIQQIPWFVSYAIEFYVTVVTMLLVIGCNLFISVLIVIGAGQFSNLNAKIKQLDIEKIKDKEDLQICMVELSGDVEYHDFLIEYVKLLDDIFAKLFAILMAIVTALLCMNMYVLSQPNTQLVDLIRCGTMVCALTTEFLFLYGVPAQTLMDEVVTRCL
ncbi:unnamed protein product [Acanthoscelides obtectus]|uniref:Uncharacterized protein n=1 Tax=Acanthoscelides obtectus TaxID=200917 RepID=A0A9P0JMT7_ACAOB|nr:unnamed protein product [Acanthoscelides obtectus]CAK1666981.1 hypothetical protein AOBTE_LOCUS25594 [Acanthoscelides obtectus]